MKKLLLTLMLFTIATFGFTQTVETFTTPGTLSWVCPAGVNSVKVETWGGGGGGGGVSNVAGRVGGGGGGGSYVINTNVAVTPGMTYTFVVGAGGIAGTTTQVTNFGLPGGFSRFTGDAITVTASGGTGGSGGTTAVPQGKGGVLGGLYGFNNIVAGTASYTAGTTTVTISGGGGTGAVAAISTASSTVANVAPTNMGSSYTSAPSIVITTSGSGTGASASALVNPDINAGGTITLGQNGSNATTTDSGAGGAGAMGGAGGASVPLAVSGSTSDGIPGIAPGGGGSGSTTNTTTTKAGSLGAAGQVKLTYTSTLPVSLTTFTAQKQAAGVQLKWNTSSEQNNSHFDIQRSVDGINFSDIGKVNGAGNSNTSLDYSFTDKSPLSGTNYYRLSQVDFDGKITLSNPLSVNMGFSNSSMTVYLSTNSSNININLSTDRASAGQLIIYNIGGQKVYEQDLSLNNGSNDLSINLPNADKGVFVATYTNGAQVLRTKFVR
ncbi:hypothetical protein A5893_15945 [Pedobacter psychrophilus]|uniref:Glycine-rich domain-containing protein n=1 Tax=Pedobacter psychrophilus TaxID=1826909 RepID=A0A179DCM3_9SPHI|nr:T9SS type A sorting domain-containing protein [Pedobacter psychrophilus]OAQ38279.1 hypothetical protein A5893_15945 [Pedobacter psychrophilus]